MSESNEEQLKRRRLDSDEVTVEDAPTRALPSAENVAAPSVNGQANALPLATDQPRKAQPGVAAAAIGTRHTIGEQVAREQAAKPRKSGPNGANRGQRQGGLRPTLPPPRNGRNDAPLVPPSKSTSPRTIAPQSPGRMSTGAMSRRKKVGLGLLVVVLLALLSGGWWVLGRYDKFRNVTQQISVTPAPVLTVDATTGIITIVTPGPGVPQPPTRRPVQPQVEPVTILLLGLDRRASDTEPPRSDTLILVRVDPITKKVAMLSFPRDLWVTIPGLQEATKDRINAAYGYGEQQQLPGGGPALAKATIKYNFGVDVDYFAEVDFAGFEKIVDTLGGVNIDVPKPLVDNEFPKNDSDLERVYIPAGIQHMDGKTALQYARSRHQDSDLGRNQRQQQVLLAIKQQGQDVMNTLANADQLLEDLRYTLRTDLNADQVLSLITLAPTIGSNITQAAIGGDMVTETILPGGADVLLPEWDKIRPLIGQLFGTNSVALEGAKILVKNGTRTEGLATKTAQELKRLGFKVVGTDNENTTSHPKTVIINYSSSKAFTVAELAKALNVSGDDIQQGSNGPADVDIVVILGEDKAAAK